MKNARLSIITVARNNYLGLQKTIASVRAQTLQEYEFIIIDGNSDDGSKQLLEENKSIIDFYVSEPDNGIYDAMNKGIRQATGDYLIFLNSGDAFNNSEVIKKLFEEFRTTDNDCYYSDARFSGKREFIVPCEFKRMRFSHQALVYKRSLHEKFGNYLVHKGITTSDYFFFNCIKNEKWKKVDFIIACCDDNGVSQKTAHYYQKLGIDLLFNNYSRIQIAVMLIIFPIYRFFRIRSYRSPKKTDK